MVQAKEQTKAKKIILTPPPKKKKKRLYKTNETQIKGPFGMTYRELLLTFKSKFKS